MLELIRTCTIFSLVEVLLFTLKLDKLRKQDHSRESNQKLNCGLTIYYLFYSTYIVFSFIYGCFILFFLTIINIKSIY